MTIQEIKKFPVLFQDNKNGSSHESLLRSYHILEKVKEMLKRGDSAKTVLEIIDECYSQ